MKKAILHTVRVLLGLLFIFSGFVKCVDPTGGAIKIEDYFVAWGLDSIPFGVCMALSFIQNIIEFVIGYMLLINVFVRYASFVALAFMVFYTPLTLYIAVANPVSDCGCFGDAVKMTNWQTFFKNLIFLPMAIALVVCRKDFRMLLARWRKVAIVIVGGVLASMISFEGITNEPMIDFRPFAVGTDINRSMSIPEDAPLPEYKTTFILSKDGVEKEFNEIDYPYNDSTWVYVDSKTVVVSEGYVPPIKDFTLSNREGESLTTHILSSTEPVILVISPKVEDIADDNVSTLASIAEDQARREREMYILTSSSVTAQDQLDQRADRGFDYLQADETMLKTMARSNPAIIVVQDGVIIAKYHINHIPAQGFDNPLSTKLTNIEAANVQLLYLSIIFAVLILLLILAKKIKFRNIYLQ